jgi:hypothetical protein
MANASAPIILNEQTGVRRIGEPVTVGLPCPRGWIDDPAHFVLIGPHGAPVPLQCEVLLRWADGSIRWALLDFQADVAPLSMSTYQLTVSPSCMRCESDRPISVNRQDAAVQVDTCAAQFLVDATQGHLFQGVSLDGMQVLDLAATGWHLEGSAGERYTPVMRRVEFETLGPLRTTLRLSGVFNDSRGRAWCDLSAAISFFAGSSMVRIAATIRNPRRARHPKNLWDLGDEGSVQLRDFSLQLTLAGTEESRLAWSAEIGQGLREQRGGGLEIYQDSSGGPHWDSRVHVNREDRLPLSFSGYRVRHGETADHGRRAQPLVALRAGTTGLAVAMRHFWQNFPKAFEIRDRSLSIRFFPSQSADLHELQGGEQKTHVLYLTFLGSGGSPQDAAWTRAPLTARSSSDWYCGAEAAPYLTPKRADPHPQYGQLVDAAIEGDDSFVAKRERIDEYGWRHFGDLYADHEGAYYTGTQPVVSHYNNQYDAIHGAIVQFLRSADTRWFQLADELACHVVDIDIYHTDLDKSAYSHGLFWHTDHYADARTATHRSFSKRARAIGGGPCAEHCYTTGLLYHYLLTGNTASRQAVLELAGWIIRSDDGRQTVLRWLDRGETGSASATQDRSYHGPGRGPANSVSALLDAFLLTRDPQFLRKADQLLRRCIHPADDIAQRNLLDPERRWSYTVFLQLLGKYLDRAVERNRLDGMFAYARASLLHYTRWMAEHEIPYLSRPERLEYPTETWSAQDMRKSDVFKFAAKYGPPTLRERFLERSRFFFQSSLGELAAAKTRSFTRPLVLLMSYGYMQAFFAHYPNVSVPGAADPEDFGTPRPFLPQRASALRRLAVLCGLLLSSAGLGVLSWLVR